jgi:hypothetical protein
MHHRRLARDYEALPTSSASMIRIAMIDNVARRVTGGSPQPGETPKHTSLTKFVNQTPSWSGTDACWRDSTDHAWASGPTELNRHRPSPVREPQGEDVRVAKTGAAEITERDSINLS